MNREQLSEEIDRGVEALLEANPSPTPPVCDSLLGVAAELRLLPSQGFHARLQAELLEQAETLGSTQACGREILPANTQAWGPSFATSQMAMLPADPRSLLLSFLSHAALVALIATGVWVGHMTLVEKRPFSELIYTPLHSGNTGGGSGGDHSLVPPSRGTPTRFSDEQLAPPVIVVHVEKPKLEADAPVLGPPDLKLSESKQLGDLFSPNVSFPSNGTGSRGGIGDRSGTGIGGGDGPGVGPGSGGGSGDHIYWPGRGITAPHVLYNPDPEYSDEARRVKYQGNVVLSLVVDPTGGVRQIRVARSLGMGLDEKAMEAVQKWRFAPGMKDGRPVAVQVNVEVNFRLY